MKIEKIIDVIGVPIEKGAGRTGPDLGPKALRYTGCKIDGLKNFFDSVKLRYNDCGDIDCPYSKIDKEPVDGFKNLPQINEVNKKLYEKVGETLKKGHFPLVIGGDHSLAVGSVLATQKHYKKIGLIWVDAHGDFNDNKSTESGNIHGMPMSAVTNNGPTEIVKFHNKSDGFVDPKNTVLIAARDIDALEEIRLKDAGVTVYKMRDILEKGLRATAESAIKIVSENTKGFYLSFDLDSLDPRYAPGVSTLVDDGLSLLEARYLFEEFNKSDKLLGVDLVELNIMEDIKGKTAENAFKLLKSILCG